ncbi:hypothetical protein [Streptomyces sp. NPDC050485]|uniref:hypothetical protein n=1 Tax=Streptomyces sp. NPDC050485 TaxID=3365617 RepID=UPI0037A9A05C
MPDSTTLQSQYAAQVHKDLETNVAERDRITAEIDVLQEQLKVLEDNHLLLTAMQQTLGTSTPPAAKTPKKPGKTAPPVGGRVPRARTADEAPRTRTGKRGQAAVKTRTRGSGPTLRELVAGNLAGAGEPRSAAEVTTALAAAHPDRNIAATAVRATLENLVAKSQAERTRQNRSVFYTLPDTAGTSTPAQPQDAASGDQAVTH